MASGLTGVRAPGSRRGLTGIRALGMGLCGYAIGPPALAGNSERSEVYMLSSDTLENVPGEVAPVRGV